MAEFRGVDFYGIEALLTEEEKLARDSVRQYVEDNVIPIVDDFYERGAFPMDLIRPLGELGVYGANLPTEYGCAGMNNVAYGLVTQELERADSGLRSFVSVQGALVMYPIFTFGSEEHRQKWLPRLATGEAIGCFGLTEPDHGSDPGGMVTRARKTSDGFVLNGAKAWITSGSIADVAVVWAKDDEGRVRGYLVEKGTPGFSAPEIHRKHSLRASVTSELFFDDCHIPEENLLPGSGGLKSPLMCLNQARYGIAWGGIGAAMACYDTSLRYALGRTQFGKPIAGFQLQQAKFAEMLTEITKMQLLCLQLGRLKDDGKVTPAQISMAKRNNVDWALKIARMARTILGANGIASEYPVMRHMNNLESVYTYEGTHDIHTLILGEAATGISAFK
jgi:glutaryl-CoA dehydrogenase